MDAITLHKKLKNIKTGGDLCDFSLKKCTQLIPLINEIEFLKKEKNAIILAHSYVYPEIIYGAADFVGDSYQLAKDAMHTKANSIIFVAVRFMAETAKILNPKKKVYLTARNGGCSLADSITPADVLALKKKFPTHAFITYINTTAEIKALCDTCVTSSNVYNIIERFPNEKIVFLPDRLMGENIKKEMEKRGVKKEIVLYDGTCYVHENYSPEAVDALRYDHPNLKVVVHPECSPEVVQKSDFVGSTSQMMHYVKTEKAKEFFLLTECGLAGRLQAELDEKKLIGACTMCRYMKSNHLEDVLRVLKNPVPADEILLSSSIIKQAKRSIDNMFLYANPPS